MHILSITGDSPAAAADKLEFIRYSSGPKKLICRSEDQAALAR